MSRGFARSRVQQRTRIVNYPSSLFLRESRDERSEFYGTVIHKYFICIWHTLNMFYVYLLENINDKGWYIGYSSDLQRRLLEHNSGKGGKTTRQKSGWKLIYYEAYLEKSDAQGRELFLKSGSGRRFLKKQLSGYLT